MSEHPNIHGRLWGRGLRPWLLMPKYFAVSLIIGGLFAIVILAVGSQFATMPEQCRFAWTLMVAIFRFQVVPGTILAALLGILLLLQHPIALLRMRWMLVKLAAVLLVVPGSHFYLSSRVIAFAEKGTSPAWLLPGVLLSLAGFVAIAILGRFKPRLGQAYRKQAAT